jgi:chemotaxis protein histidine kinase CheA
MAEEINYNVKVNTNDATKNLNSLQSSMEGVIGEGGKIDGITQKFSAMPGALGQASSAMSGLGKQMWALVANPIGAVIAAIVAGITLLYKAFTSTNEGADKLDQGLAGLSAAFEVVMNAIAKVAENLIGMFENPQKALSDFADMLKENITNRFEGLLELLPQLGKAISLLFEGEFSEAGKVATDAVGKVALGVEDITDKVSAGIDAINQLGAEALVAANKAAKIEKILQGVEDGERALRVERSKQAKQLATARLQMEDDTATFESRIEALKKVAQSEEELAAKELKLAKAKANAISARNKLTDASDEALSKEAEAIARVNDLEAESIMRKRKVVKAIESLNNQKTASEKEAAKAVEDGLKATAQAEKEALDNKIKLAEDGINAEQDAKKLLALKTIEDQKALNAELERIETERTQKMIDSKKAFQLSTTELEIKAAQDAANKKFDIEKENAEKEKDLAKKNFDAKIAIYEATSNALSALTQLVGEQTAMGKALAVASTIIDTYTGATKALAQGGVLGYIGMAAVLATGFANVRKIVSTEIPGQSASGGAPSMGPSVSIIGGTADPSAQMAASLNKNMNKPAKAYVVGNDMSSQQALDRRIQTNATFPG